jgi:hypothetical protein
VWERGGWGTKLIRRRGFVVEIELTTTVVNFHKVLDRYILSFSQSPSPQVPKSPVLIPSPNLGIIREIIFRCNGIRK